MIISNSINNYSEKSSWSSWINPYHNLEMRISTIATSTIQNTLTPQQKADLLQGFKLAHCWTWPAGRMRTLLATIPKETILVLMNELLTSCNDKDREYYFSRCLGFLDTNSLLDLSGFKTSNIAHTSFQCHALTKSTVLKNGLEKEGRAIWKEFLIELNYFIHQLMEILLSLTGLNEATRQKASMFDQSSGRMSSYEANSKIALYLQLITYPAAIFGLVYSMIELTAPAILLTFAIVVASLTILIAYNRYWKPCPIDHAGLKNLTIDLLREKNPIYPRRDILKKIEMAFQSKKGVILVGPPGEGKSWIARSFVEQASAGKICKFIKNPQVFACNGSDFNDLGMASISLSSIEESFKRHTEKVVFFIDEFHCLFKENKLLGSAAGEKIKTFCEDFKYVIGATTTEEYEKFLEHQPAIVDRRFEVIRVNPMDRDQIKISLSQYLESTNSKTMFDPAVIDYIIDNAAKFNSKTSTVDAAHSLLNTAIQKMSLGKIQQLEEKIVALEDQLGVIEQALIHQGVIPEAKKMDDLIKQLNDKKTEIENVKKELDQKKLQKQHLQKIEAYLLKLKQQSYQLAKPDVDLAKNSALEREWIDLHARIKVVAEFITKERDALGLPNRLDGKLIDSILINRPKTAQVSLSLNSKPPHIVRP